MTAIDPSAACVGVFYKTPICLLTDQVPIAEAKSNSVAISHGDHSRLWQLADAATRLSVANSYSALPRGRVLYHIGASRFHLYADRCIPMDVLAQIARQFGLPAGGYDIRRDPHYRCSRCLPSFISDDVGQDVGEARED